MNQIPNIDSKNGVCLYPDHDVLWGGDGYYCTKCNMKFGIKL
jgi:hypothetical protein